MRSRGRALAAALACLASPLAGQQPTPGRPGEALLSAAIDSMALDPIRAGRVAGMSIGVVRGEDTLHLEAYGSADLELDVPTPEDAVYEIGSVTKQFTAAAVLLLQEEGRLSLDDDLSRWMPDFPLEGRRIPIRRLLDHTSGIRGYTEMASFGSIARQRLPRDTLVALVAAEPFDFEPGEAMIYNNSAYFLLGLIIEKASGLSYEDFVESRLFEPAGMRDSRYCHKDELTPGRAKGFQPGTAGHQPGTAGHEAGTEGLRPADPLDHTWPYSAGSLCSTVRDLIRWNQALHGDGEGGRLLGAGSYAELLRPGALLDGTPLRYAKGLAITERDGHPRIAHGGGIYGYVSELRYLPDEDLTIAVLINTAGTENPATIADRIEDLVLGPAAPVRRRAFGGYVEPLLGRFRGPSRGRRMTAVVSLSEDGRLLVRTSGEPQPVEWLGGLTFGHGSTRYRFVRHGEAIDVLQVDHVGGLYVLRRTAPR